MGVGGETVKLPKLKIQKTTNSGLKDFPKKAKP